MRIAGRLAVAGTAVILGVAGFTVTASAKGGSVGGSGAWYYLNDTLSGNATTVFTYGASGDDVYVGDWNGDGKDTLMVRRGATFYARNSNSNGPADQVFSYGRSTDTVLVGDWNGDGTDTLAVRRGNTYYVKNSISPGAADSVFSFGRPDDTVLVGDWDGNRTDTLAIRRGNTYYVKNNLVSGSADRVFTYGTATDRVLVGHWSSGQSGDSLGIRRGNTYYLRYSLTSGNADSSFTYGSSTDTTLVGDWNADGVDTLGVRRPSGPPVGGDWLGEVNKYRQGAGLSAVTENPAWNTGLLHHFTYLERTPYTYFTGQYQSLHTENPASPYYTADGATEGGRSNLAMSSGNTPVSYIDEWLAAPFHAVGILRPGLQQVAFGSANGYSGLDVLGGYTYQSRSTPVLFPGSGMTTNLRSYGGENPSPLETCGWPDGLGTSYGLPLVALLPSAPPAGATGSVTGSDGSVRTTSAGSLCLVDEVNYHSSDTVYGPTGLSILRGDHAVFLISRTVYGPGTYSATINEPGFPSTRWTFTVS